MNCLINLLALCLYDPSAVYVTGEVYQPHYRWNEGGLWCRYHRCEGPMGELRLGVNVPMTRMFDLNYGFKHQSFIMEDDTGMNTVFVSVTWRPFR